MFVISQSETYVWPVEINAPIDGGTWKKETFDGVFKRISQSRIEEIKKSSAEGMGDVEFAKEVLVGWSGITDNDSKEVPFTESTRDRLLDIPMVAGAVVIAFLNSLSGARRKN